MIFAVPYQVVLLWAPYHIFQQNPVIYIYMTKYKLNMILISLIRFQLIN